MSSTIYTDQHAPGGRTIRFNVDMSTAAAAHMVNAALRDGVMLDIPNEDGGDPIYVNPERVATISPRREEGIINE